jgi:hypothetical protein
LVLFDPDFHPKGALLRLLRGTPASGSGGHPDAASGQTLVTMKQVFGGAMFFTNNVIYIKIYGGSKA